MFSDTTRTKHSKRSPDGAERNPDRRSRPKQRPRAGDGEQAVSRFQWLIDGGTSQPARRQRNSDLRACRGMFNGNAASPNIKTAAEPVAKRAAFAVATDMNLS